LNLFIEYFISESNAELNKNVLGVAEETRSLLHAYDWPGNIRELKNIIRRACLLTPTDSTILKTSLPEDFLSPAPVAEVWKTPHEDDFRSRTTNYLKKMIEKAELEQIMTVLKQVNYNKTKAASLLNIDRKTLYNKMKRFE